MQRKLLVALAAVAVIGIAAGLVLPALQPAREHIPRPKCVSNLKQIALACQIYSNDNDEDFPPSLGALVSAYVTDGTLFLCPAAGRAVEIEPSDIPEGARDASAVWSERFTDYVYVQGLRASAPPDAVVAFDRDGNHEGGRWVAFVGGHVLWMNEPEFRAALAATAAWLREHPLPAPAVGDDQF